MHFVLAECTPVQHDYQIHDMYERMQLFIDDELILLFITRILFIDFNGEDNSQKKDE